MLPPAPKDVGRLSDVFISALGAISGGDLNRLKLPRVKSAVVVLVDGLGYLNLKEHAGHARNLIKLLNDSGDQSIRVGFPSTTAVSLTSFGTGIRAGGHGILGYQTRDAKGTVRNMLSGWSASDEPRSWQTNPTVSELAVTSGVTPHMIASPEYEATGFTEVFMAGATFHAAGDISRRVGKAKALVSRPNSLCYLYFAELDQAAHRFGVASTQWLTVLEQIDSALGELSGNFGCLITGDHGIIDVPAENHVYVDAVPGFIDAVSLAIGDPRALYCYGDRKAAEVALSSAGVSAYLATFEQLTEAGWVTGSTTIDDVPDFVLIARGVSAFYDRRTAKTQSLKMIGQHGALDDRETRVPLIRAGGFA